MNTPTPAAATVADEPLTEPEPALEQDHAREVKPAPYRPNRHERRKAEALARKEQRGRK